MKAPRINRAGSAGLGVALTAALLIGALLVQHHRHGWPFSLHHGITAAEAPPAPAAAHEADPHAAHPRVAVDVEPGRMEGLGIRVEPARPLPVGRPIRVVATVVPDESRISHVHTRVAGWIEKLHVSTTGQRVRAGQPLAEIFSQELLSSQVEYLAARHAAASGPASTIATAARERLRVFGMTEAEIRSLEKRGKPRRLVTVPAPFDGVVLRRAVSVGTAVDPSTELLTVADLSQVWVLAEVPEADIPEVRPGVIARLSFPAAGREPIEAPVAFLYPTLSERTRTLRVRFVVDNPDGALRPGLYGEAEIQVVPRDALTVPRDAVVDTGAEQHVFVVVGPGLFEPRRVELGARLEDRVEIRAGLAAGEEVVSSGVFLIDSESRLRATGGGHAGHGSPTPKPAEPTSHGGHGSSM